MTAKYLTLTVLLSLTIISGCGGGSMTPAPVTTQAAITSAQVFSNTPQTWNFTDGFGHHMTIAISPVACAFGYCGDITVWHYTKDSCAGYWNTRTPEQCAVATTLDELYFVLRHDADGAWRCIGFTDVDYLGVKRKVQINTPQGQAPPYTIIPVSSAVSDPNTSYNAIIQTLAFDADLADFSPAVGMNFSTTWRTDASAKNGDLISDQNEGCVKEYWAYDAKGLRIVIPIVGLGNNGACVSMDPKFTMERTN